MTHPDKLGVEFTYDALGRRLTKSFGENTTHFVWDGNVPLHEWTSLNEETITSVNDKGEQMLTVPEDLITWVFEDGTFAPMAKLQGGKSYSIITDHLGTPFEAYDEDGNRVWERQLDIYGGTKKEMGEVNFIPYLYQGQYLDVETELAYNRFRYYSTESGTYISQDPIGLDGGMPNMYSYVLDSNCRVDQLGLAGHVVATLTLPDGTEFVAKSKKATLTGEFADLVESIKKDLALKGKLKGFHGNCGEIRAIRKALDAGYSLVDLKGAKIKAVIKGSGEIKKACDCCSEVLEKLDVDEIKGCC